MKWLKYYLLEIGLSILAIASMTLFFSIVYGFAFVGFAHAQEVATGRGLFCDTAAQVERYLAVPADADDALKQVNEGLPKAVCGIADVAFYVGDTVSDVRTKDGTWRITKIFSSPSIRTSGGTPPSPRFSSPPSRFLRWACDRLALAVSLEDFKRSLAAREPWGWPKSSGQIPVSRKSLTASTHAASSYAAQARDRLGALGRPGLGLRGPGSAPRTTSPYQGEPPW